ncbi:thioredoxin domain-containing protein [Heterostelium album PN500]|uniref:Thioredoxin domain-containing protein n=1 Tax=Heterostelium pallidum (strain ATCC 26659 / Pp 5 / PN500) TaxID=670386 RepID=D3B012_HETP5|nr:thioredoxin domain-containing protein [Heterostelium album PN500]EFA84636.1 thioredoxin domain-containing protein [Heterostelium album PN500]|eukprot:XP_020436749.1 thioredoxin domain-containing protein [Heterostelium album PN500]
MSNVAVYTSSATGMLKIKKDQQALKTLLEAKGIKYIEYDVASDQEKREHMKKVSGKTELPQLFVNDKFVGNYDDCQALEEVDQFMALFN